jgi:glycosyltransferase involved in cell wall biosynthesis
VTRIRDRGSGEAIKLSVIIPCYNAAETIATQLEALAGQQSSESWEIIVSNNRSTDDSMAIVERYSKRLPYLRVVDASTQQGQPYALNVGAQAARGEALAFCDADDEVAPEWVATMGDALSKYDFVSCSIDSEKLNPTWLKGIHGNVQRAGLQKIWYPPYLPHAGGGTLGIKKSLHDAVGGFDESLPYLHDTDYCFKVQLLGVKLHFVPNAITHVRYRYKLRGIFHQAHLWAEYNILLYKRYRALALNTEYSHAWKRYYWFFQPWLRYMRDWNRLLLRLPEIRHKAGRAAWAKRLGWQIGRLHGSIKHRVHPV